MHIIQYPFIIYIVNIFFHNHCTAWVLPMVKRSELQFVKNVDNLQENAPTADPKDVIGIQLIKFTREDPTMQIFDFDMDLARKFAYNEWQKLFDVYVPLPNLQMEEHIVRVPVHDLPNLSQKYQSKFMKSVLPAKLEYDEVGTQRVAQALKDMHGSEDIHQGLK